MLVVHVHESLNWAFHAQAIAGEMLPLRATNLKPGWDGFIDVLNEARLQIAVTGLLEEVELRLKGRLTTFLKKTHGSSWWAVLPERVQRSAAARHRWSTTQLGARAVTEPHETSWLTLGDVILVLDGLPATDWMACLVSETRRKSEFKKVFYRIKGFRDYYVAHPKPDRTSTAAMLRLCSAVQRIPLIIRPAEWQKAMVFLEAIRSLPKEQRSSLHYNASGWTKRSPRLLEVQVGNLLATTPGSIPRGQRISAKEIKWQVALLRSCASSDTTGKIFFGLGA